MDSKVVSLSPRPFSQTVVISFLIFLVTPLIQADEDDQVYFTGISPIVFWCIVSTYVDSVPWLKSWKSFPGFTSSNNIRIYTETAHFVVISYVSLLFVNWSNIWLAIFPLIAIGFILALCYELSCHQSRRSRQPDDGEVLLRCGGGDDEEGERYTKKAEGQEAAALVPYWVLCAMKHYPAGADNLAVSLFLLFFSSMLAALALMMTRLELTGAGPGVASASQLLRKASLVALLATVHAFAAELLGENVILFTLPELAPVLVWFSIHLNRQDGSFITVEKIKSNRNVITVVRAASVAVFAFLAASMDEFVLAWCTKAMVACGVSGFLLYYLVFMLRGWPGLDTTATEFAAEAVKLLKLWANILLMAAAALLLLAFLAADWLGVLEQMVSEPSKILTAKM